MKGYPRYFFALLLGTFVGLSFSGALLTPMTLEIYLGWEMPWRANGATRLWTTALHALFGFVMIGFLGALWALHIRQGWKRKKNRRSGGTVTTILILLLLTGVGIYYLGNETGSSIVALMHLVLGWFLPALFFFHWMRGRRR